MSEQQNNQPVDMSAAGTAWYWGPYLTAAVAAGVGVGLRGTEATTALLVLPLVSVLPVALLLAAFGIAVLRKRELVLAEGPRWSYVALASAACGAWVAAVGHGWWPLACAAGGAVVGGAVAWWMRTQRAAIWPGVAGIAGAVALVVSLALRPGADVVPPIRWVIAWFIGTSALCVPAWSCRRLRKKALPTVLPDLEGLGSTLAKHARTRLLPVPGSVVVETNPERWSVKYRTSEGRTVPEVIGAVERTETELGWRPGALTISAAQHRRDEFTATVTPQSALTAGTRPALPTSILEPAPFGTHDDGRPMAVSIYDAGNGARAMLSSGKVGSGKSRGMAGLLDSWTNCRDVVFLFADLSGGSMSTPWDPCSLWTVKAEAECVAMLEGLAEVATYRAGLLPKLGWECWQPSPEMPAIVVPIDEFHKLAKHSYAARQKANSLLQVARKSGIVMVLATPFPAAQEGIEPALRAQLAYRVCFQASMGTASFVFDGSSASAFARRVTEFNQPGQVLGTGPDLDAVPGRTFDVPLADQKASGVAHAAWRPRLDMGSAAALERGSKGAWKAPKVKVTKAAAGERAADASPAEPVSVEDTAEAAVARWSEDKVSGAVMAVLNREGGPIPGREWAAPVDLPPAPPAGRLSRQQVLEVMRRLMSVEGGASPAEMVAATGRSRSLVNEILAGWLTDGLAVSVAYGKHEWAGARSDVV